MRRALLASLFVLAWTGKVLAEPAANLVCYQSGAACKAAVGDLDHDGLQEVAVGYYSSSSQAKCKLYHLVNGTLVKIWEQAFSADKVYPLFADVDNDGQQELLISSDSGDLGGALYIYDSSSELSDTHCIWSSGFSTLRRERAVSVGDVDNDGQNELCIAVDWYSRQLRVYEQAGANSWALSWSTGGNDFRSSFIGDTDNDGQNELLAGCGNWSYWDWRVYEYGDEEYQLQFDSGYYGAVTAICGDPDQDGLNEVIVSSTYDRGGRDDLTLARWNGLVYEEVWNWDAGLSTHGPALGPLLGDGRHQIAVFSGYQTGAPADARVHLFSFDGSSASEIWQSGEMPGLANGDCCIADADNDGLCELLFCQRDSGFYIWRFQEGSVAGVEEQPFEFALSAYPNPFNPSTTIELVLPETSRMTVGVYNLRGQCVTRLHDGLMNSGLNRLKWNPGQLASGVYLLLADGSAGRQTTKLLYQR